MAPPAVSLAILQVMCVLFLKKNFYFEIKRAELLVFHPQLDAAWVRRGAEERGAPSADQGARGEESQQPPPPLAPESESRTGWIPLLPRPLPPCGGGPERDPRCHGRGLGSGEGAVLSRFRLLSPLAGRCCAAGDGESAISELNLGRFDILLLTCRMIYTASVPRAAEPITRGEDGGWEWTRIAPVWKQLLLCAKRALYTVHLGRESRSSRLYWACSISTVSKVLSLLPSRFIFTMHSHSCSKSVWEPYLSELLLPSPNITHISSNGSCWKIKAFLSKFSSQTGTFCVTLCCLFFSPTPLGVIN